MQNANRQTRAAAEAESTLAIAESLPKVAAKPFFYARLNARLQSRQQHTVQARLIRASVRGALVAASVWAGVMAGSALLESTADASVAVITSAYELGEPDASTYLLQIDDASMTP